MNLTYLLILTLPILLNIQGNPSLLIFLGMNTIINLLMQYTRIKMQILGSLLNHEDNLTEQMQDGITEEAAEEWIPKPIIIASDLSMTISILGILIGIVNWFS